jgi:cell division protein WhiA
VPLSEELRNELAAIAPRRECDRLAELSGLFHTAGSLHLRGRGEVAVHLDLATPAAARRAFGLLRAFGVAAEIRTYRRRAFGRETRYQVYVEGESRALQVLHEAGVVSAALAPLERPPKRVVARACCRGAYLRGALLGSGSLSGPRSPHLEVRTASRVGAELIASTARAAGAPMAVQVRGRHAAAYAKGVDAIAGAIAAAGASETALAFQERAVVGATKSRANRLANADHANLVRTSRAAQVQIRAVRKLERRGDLADLPQPLREIARLRVRHPALSLRELGARCKPPATKSSAQRRLAKLVRLAGS